MSIGKPKYEEVVAIDEQLPLARPLEHEGSLAPHGNSSPREAVTEMRCTENLIPVLHWIGWRKQKIQVAEMF